MATKKFYILLLSTFFAASSAFAQITLNSTSPDYNAPYDTLIARGDKGYNAGKMLGVKTPALSLMFYNRAIEIDKDRFEAYNAKGTAYMEYEMYDDAIEAFTTCLEVSADNPQC